MGGKILRGTEKDITEKIRRAKKIIFFLDYDGTLTPIGKRPERARLKPRVRAVLKKLAKSARFSVFIISGRSLKDIKRFVGISGLSYVGNHGIECDAPNIRYINKSAGILKPFIQSAYKALRKKLKIKGLILEHKTYTLSLHYRLADPGKIPAVKKIFYDTIEPFRKAKKIKITKGKKVLEVRPDINWDKGKIVDWILKKIQTKNTLPVYIGDDRTDEDAFKALDGRGITILVSEKTKKTRAQYRLTSPEEVVKFLKQFANYEPLD